MQKLFCMQCDEKVFFNLKEEEFIIKVKEEDFPVFGKRAFCSNCDEELFHLEHDSANQKQAFDAYCKKHGVDRVR